MSPAELAAWATAAIAVFTGGVGVTACFLVWHGIGEMRRSSEERARDRKASDDANRQSSEAFMEANRRSSEADRQRHEEAMEALRAQSRALEELIRRTAPAAPAE